MGVRIGRRRLGRYLGNLHRRLRNRQAVRQTRYSVRGDRGGTVCRGHGGDVGVGCGMDRGPGSVGGCGSCGMDLFCPGHRPPGAYMFVLVCAAGIGVSAAHLPPWQVGLLVLAGGTVAWLGGMTPRSPTHAAREGGTGGCRRRRRKLSRGGWHSGGGRGSATCGRIARAVVDGARRLPTCPWPFGRTVDTATRSQPRSARYVRRRDGGGTPRRGHAERRRGLRPRHRDSVGESLNRRQPRSTPASATAGCHPGQALRCSQAGIT